MLLNFLEDYFIVRHFSEQQNSLESHASGKKNTPFQLNIILSPEEGHFQFQALSIWQKYLSKLSFQWHLIQLKGLILYGSPFSLF